MLASSMVDINGKAHWLMVGMNGNAHCLGNLKGSCCCCAVLATQGYLHSTHFHDTASGTLTMSVFHALPFLFLLCPLLSLR